jgi:uncharacterized protein YdcH (DUF465 family)
MTFGRTEGAAGALVCFSPALVPGTAAATAAATELFRNVRRPLISRAISNPNPSPKDCARARLFPATGHVNAAARATILNNSPQFLLACIPHCATFGALCNSRPKFRRAGGATMATVPGDFREKILNGDPEYQKLLQEHSQYAAQLEQIEKSPYLNSEDLIQEITLKKMKLKAKDAIEQRVAHLAHRILV